MKFAGWFGIILGAMMITQWSFFLLTGNVPELQTEPRAISFHLAAEFIAAVCLIAGGAGLLLRKVWSARLFPIASGMVLYSIIASSGYFAERDQWGMVGMFAAVGAVTLLALKMFSRRQL